MGVIVSHPQREPSAKRSKISSSSSSAKRHKISSSSSSSSRYACNTLTGCFSDMEGEHETLDECAKKCKVLPKSLGGLLGYSVEAMYLPILQHMVGRGEKTFVCRDDGSDDIQADHLDDSNVVIIYGGSDPETNINLVVRKLRIQNLFIHTLDVVAGIGDNFLHNCPSLISVTFLTMAYVTTLGNRFLSECRFLKIVDFSGLNKLATVGNKWLYECDALESVICANMVSLEHIGESWLMRASKTGIRLDTKSLVFIEYCKTWAVAYIVVNNIYLMIMPLPRICCRSELPYNEDCPCHQLMYHVLERSAPPL